MPRTRRRSARFPAAVRRLLDMTRPEPAELARVLDRRWAEIPAGLRTASQSIGRRTAGCEGTQGVFPRCNLACTPCYLGRDANRVRTDGDHTEAEVRRQMARLRERRGPWQNAQLIGGEVTLLGPRDHARALSAMLAASRKPMSMTHGDFDDDYLERLALRPDGTRRFKRLIFAGHFDRMMRGRRGAARPATEAELDPHRRRFIAAFDRMRRRHRVGSYLAHNMTVTPANLDEVPGVIRRNGRDGWRMFSFQPAAFQGDAGRWREEYRAIGADEVWRRIEEGAGARLPHRAVQVGDPRCNRSSQGGYVGESWIPLLNDRDPRDLRLRDAVFRGAGGLNWEVHPALALARGTRALARTPSLAPLVAGWAVRMTRRAGGPGRLRREGFRPVTFVMHRFMDAAEVVPAWEMLERGRMSDDPAIRGAQERLLGCSYHMAHPETGRLIPACAQHAVFDGPAHARLARSLPRSAAAGPAAR